MTTTRSRSATIPVGSTDVRVHISGDGLVTYCDVPIGRVVVSAHGWRPASRSGITGREYSTQIEAAAVVVGRFHRQAEQARIAESTRGA